MEQRTCRYCGERAFKLPFAHGDEWVDSKGERWLFHVCQAVEPVGARGPKLRSGPGNLPYKPSSARLAAARRRIADRENAEKRSEAATKRKLLAARHRFSQSLQSEDRRWKKIFGRRKPAHKSNLYIFHVVADEIGPLELNDFLRKSGLKTYSKPQIFRSKLKKYVKLKINADENQMKKYDLFVMYHLSRQKA